MLWDPRQRRVASGDPESHDARKHADLPPYLPPYRQERPSRKTARAPTTVQNRGALRLRHHGAHVPCVVEAGGPSASNIHAYVRLGVHLPGEALTFAEPPRLWLRFRQVPQRAVFLLVLEAGAPAPWAIGWLAYIVVAAACRRRRRLASAESARNSRDLGGFCVISECAVHGPLD